MSEPGQVVVVKAALLLISKMQTVSGTLLKHKHRTFFHHFSNLSFLGVGRASKHNKNSPVSCMECFDAIYTEEEH